MFWIRDFDGFSAWKVETRLRYLPGNQNVVADFISRNNINDTKKLDVLRFNALELSPASYRH